MVEGVNAPVITKLVADHIPEGMVDTGDDDAAGDDVLEARDNAGDVPLHVACRAGALECVRLLLETAADPQAKNNMGETPSDCASGHVLALVAEYAPPPPNDEAFDLGGDAVDRRARIEVLGRAQKSSERLVAVRRRRGLGAEEHERERRERKRHFRRR